MGDDWDYDDDDFMYEDPDYIYAEESWALADELASNALPQPAWPDEVLDDFWGDYDKYEYFEDIEYGNDDYFDQEVVLDDAIQNASVKRKREDTKGGTKLGKRRKVESLGAPPVLWISTKDARDFEIEQDRPVTSKSLPSYALLPDWRERLRDACGFFTVPALSLSVDGDATTSSDDDQHVDDDWEDDEEGAIEAAADGDLPPDLLKDFLAAKLAESGIGGASQGAFMESIMQMMSGAGGPSEELLESLTSTLLGQVSDGDGDPSMTEWLAQKGVNLTEDLEVHEQAHDASTTVDSEPTSQTHAKVSEVAEPATVKSGRKRKKTGSMLSHEIRGSTADGDEESSEEASQSISKRAKLEDDNAKPAAGGELDTSPPAKLRSEKSTTQDSDDKNGRNLDAHQQTHNQPISSKRKAAAAAEAVAEKPVKHARGGFAAPTASSQRKVSETLKKAAEPLKKTTRSGRKRE
ncbi:hypothetical protein AAFC00_000825 [Neodothiora populina]|uniref:Uncharacterized protein n=1 Tax=Neodothiora populina TaxID=2781224 RepID=A0ABR3PLY0_9PEZI